MSRFTLFGPKSPQGYTWDTRTQGCPTKEELLATGDWHETPGEAGVVLDWQRTDGAAISAAERRGRGSSATPSGQDGGMSEAEIDALARLEIERKAKEDALREKESLEQEYARAQEELADLRNDASKLDGRPELHKLGKNRARKRGEKVDLGGDAGADGGGAKAD